MRKLPHKSKLTARWWILLFLSIVMLGQYYTYDNPSALHVQLEDYFTHSDEATVTDSSMAVNDFETFFNNLYSFYSLPNMFVPFLGGVLVDIVGTRIMVVVLISLVTLGQTLTAIGISLLSPGVSLCGRFLFGLGAGTLCATMSTVLAQWFKGRELAFAVGALLSVARLGSVINDNLTPVLNKNFGLIGTFYIGSCLLCVSVICAIIMFILDRNAERSLSKSNAILVETLLADGYEIDKSNDSIHNIGETETAASVSLLWKTVYQTFRNIRSYTFGYWLIVISCLVIYGAVIPFHSISQKFVIEKFFCAPVGQCCDDVSVGRTCPNYNTQTTNAGFAISLPYSISIFCFPLFGAFIDRFGRRAVFIFISSALIICVHTGLFLANLSDLTMMYIFLVIQGIAYPMFGASIWSSVAYVVNERNVGTAYGLMTSIQNIGLFSFPVIIGSLYTHLGSYEQVEPFFSLLGVIGLTVAIMLNFWDRINGGYLNNTEREMKENFSVFTSSADISFDEDYNILQP